MARRRRMWSTRTTRIARTTRSHPDGGGEKMDGEKKGRAGGERVGGGDRAGGERVGGGDMCDEEGEDTRKGRRGGKEGDKEARKMRKYDKEETREDEEGQEVDEQEDESEETKRRKEETWRMRKGRRSKVRQYPCNLFFHLAYNFGGGH
ncbi:hypothetical protein CBR_g37529 [Chara braunii]|uniref:Uncharacterized protein n=1 Tax=Chara braunii TaxID=69332 RepID=A0A388LN31_CHABU|nr:hypothetical protein CBR_g37529 [Chara braunii]|eukprot:GBG83728.1 hypothetical protein CBR_g37529 [Chara braunii]